MSPSQPEAKCDWARGGCAGDQFLRLGGKPLHRGASNQNREGQVLGVQYPTHSNLFFRVIEDGVKLIKPETKCDWARGGCSGAKSHPARVVVHKDTTKKLRRDSAVTGL